MPRAASEPPVVLFDGACNLCNASIHFMIDRDPAGTLRFAAQQSPVGQRLLAERGLAGQTGSVVLIEDGRAYTRSTASLRAARYLRWPWRWARWLVIVPRPLRDAVYRLIAANRYRLFGRREACRLPSPAVRERFLDAP
jgi:predicted DCC family thiol-disulfide oxidoreductase YuxK